MGMKLGELCSTPLYISSSGSRKNEASLHVPSVSQSRLFESSDSESPDMKISSQPPGLNGGYIW